jgi:alkanesulfonate monooxygenase SsuD/methylene tetrahydromethanopterin reductase-like flavin-dependent oxidoreductase (luciferase family)
MEQTNKTIHPWVDEGAEKIRMGVHFMDPCLDWNQYCDATLAAESLGFDSIWVADHPTLIADCWTTLSALASRTTTIRLGSLVTCALYRHPVLLARMATDVDRISNGRMVLGMGIGDMPPEFRALGLQYLSVRQRQEILEETIQVVKELWKTAPVAFEGKHLQVQAQLPVGPVQEPTIPVLIAGGGERRTLRQVAQYADVANFGSHAFTGSAVHLDDVERKCHVLQEHCLQVGRAQPILRSYLTMPFFVAKTPQTLLRKQQALPAEVLSLFQSNIVALGPQEAIDYFQGLIEAGIQYFIVGVGLRDRETLELLRTEIWPALKVNQPSEQKVFKLKLKMVW